MRYFALGNKATIKISDDNLTLENIKQDAIKMKIVMPEEADQIKEIKRDEFIKPIDKSQFKKPKKIVYQETDYGPVASWQNLIDSLKVPDETDIDKKP